MKLVIVESPGKLKTIRQILGAGWQVEASVGHIRDLPEKEIGVAPPDFKPSYVPTERGKEVIAKLRKAAQAADSVYLATDQDREGEAIAWHIKQALRLENPQRIRFGEITPKAVKTAIANPSAIDINQVAAQEGRRVLDRLVGYLVSPKLSELSGRRGLSAGRVQSIAVRIVLERERAIQNFKPTNHFGVQLSFGSWFADWDSKPFLPDGQKYLLDETLAKKVAALRQVQVIDCTEKTEQRNPPAPFITSTLQQAASNKLKMNPKKTMEVAQKLYEQGHITYMRTDSPNLSDDALLEIYQVCQEKGLPMVDMPRTWKSTADAQEAHECIRPTHFEAEEAGDTQEQQALYKLIWQRTVACQLSAARYAVRVAHLRSIEDVDGKTVDFTAKGRSLIYPGWLSLIDDDTQSDDDKEKEKEGANNPVPELDSWQTINALDGKAVPKKTRAPARYTQAELVKELERQGIGRPSTYAAIMDTIMKRGYVSLDKQGKFLAAEDTGALVVDALMKSGFSFMQYDFTRSMERQLDAIAQGESTYRSVVSLIYERLQGELSHLHVSVAPEHPCPSCGKALLRLKPKKEGGSPFWGCSGYPECETTLPDAAGKPGKPKPRQVADAPCPECGKSLIRRFKIGKKGFDFWGCSGFPKCSAKFDNVSGKPKF